MTRHIEVWYDETSDSENPAWCVSLCEEDGDEIRCISTHENADDAFEAAERSAEKLGMVAMAR